MIYYDFFLFGYVLSCAGVNAHWYIWVVLIYMMHIVTNPLRGFGPVAYLRWVVMCSLLILVYYWIIGLSPDFTWSVVAFLVSSRTRLTRWDGIRVQDWEGIPACPGDRIMCWDDRGILSAHSSLFSCTFVFFFFIYTDWKSRVRVTI